MEDQYWILSDSNSVYLNIPFVRYQAQILRHINTTITVFWVFFSVCLRFRFLLNRHDLWHVIHDVKKLYVQVTLE